MHLIKLNWPNKCAKTSAMKSTADSLLCDQYLGVFQMRDAVSHSRCHVLIHQALC